MGNKVLPEPEWNLERMKLYPPCYNSSISPECDSPIVWHPGTQWMLGQHRQLVWRNLPTVPTLAENRTWHLLFWEASELSTTPHGHWSEAMWWKVSSYRLKLAAQREKRKAKTSSSFFGFSPSMDASAVGMLFFFIWLCCGAHCCYLYWNLLGNVFCVLPNNIGESF